MTGILLDAVHVLTWIVLGYFVLLNAGYLITSMLAFGALRRHARRMKLFYVEEFLSAENVPTVTLIAPAYNEEATCVPATTALLAQQYPRYEVFVVNDGSKDRTLAVMIEAFDLEEIPRAPSASLPCARVKAVYRSRRRPNLYVLDKENGGKADALNAGLNYCRGELFCALDADTLLERDALARVVRPFLEDRTLVAAGGIIRIANDVVVKGGVVTEVRLPKRLLPQLQVVEYLRAFLSGRMGWDALNATLIISGAFGLFQRAAVVEAGGYRKDTVGEDMELVVRLHRYCRDNRIPYRVGFVPDPVAWTEAPESLRVLGRQRDRWQRGLLQVLWMHRGMLFRPRYGRIGMVAYPYFLFLEGLGPIIEVGGYIAFAIQLLLVGWSPLFALAFFGVAIGLGMAISIAAVGLEEMSLRRYERPRDLFGLFGLAVIEPLGYRQLSTWWRLKGVVSAIRGVHAWGEMERRGFSPQAATAEKKEP
ncbi:MAG: glycosyltransferase family 2 protein [Gemmatimonadaceae bacterium]|nr:glycosyltransferase family 2 protein [Gemmatimonadaceae bacterium]